jgi:1,2-diacylglycerol-3-alpha-glucose alpha-1,2-galactosyltransferase
MKIHVVSETEFVMKATGVHTAFVDHVTLLKEKDDIDVVVNNEGYGDIFHGHTYGLYYFWQGRKYKGRRVFTVHVIPDSIKGSLPLWKLFMPLVRFGLKQVYSYSDVCIAISPAVEQAILGTGANTRIVRIYNPVHTDFWKRSVELRKKGRQMLGTGENDFVVLGSGQLIGRKGIEDFIDIAAAVPEAKFVWAGGRPFGGLSEGIRRIDEKIKAASVNFSYAGNFELESMPAVYAAADLMLFPSFQENCPLAPLEAAASGIPVIFRDIEEYRSLYENPYLAAVDPAEFIEITRRMIFDKDFYEEGKEMSRQLIIQFDKEAIRRKLLDLYSYLLDYSGTSSDCLNTHPQLSLG